MKLNDYHVIKIFELSRIPKMLCIVAALFLCPFLLFGQGKTFAIKGTVTDKQSPLPGTSVILEGTSTGTITDQNGNYEFTITSDQSSVTIAFSSIGYRRQVHQV